MPRTESQFEEIRESRRLQIMNAALELFANEGYYTTSISKIATKAGISKGLIYNYFSSKEELVKAIIHNGFTIIFSTFDKNKDGILTDEEMVFFIDENFRMLKENLQYWKLYYAIMMQPAVLNLVVKEYKEIIPAMIGIISNYFRQKGAKQPEMEALYFGAMIDGISFNYVMTPEHYPLEQMKSFIIEKISNQSK